MQESDYGKVIREREAVAQKLILELSKDNPLIGKGPEEMLAINARNLHYQDALRQGMVAGMITGGNLIAGFNGAMTGLLMALASVPDSEQARESIGYILGLSEAVKSIDDGPIAILNGELNVECMLRPGDTPSEEMRKHFNLPEGPITEGGASINVKREGNVIDAADLFTKGGRTVH